VCANVEWHVELVCVCCSALQCVAVRCSVLQCVAVQQCEVVRGVRVVLQCVAMCS